MKKTVSKRVLSVLLCIALMMTCLPLSLMAAGAAADNRVVDAETLNYYENLFYNGTGAIDTYAAGAVWTDKSVVTDPTRIHSGVTMKDENNNFLVALSAIASNKEIVGYSAIPTDTMFILDASSSMESGDIRDATNATNEAIKKLNSLGNHNRIGVIVYNGTATTLLDLDRYTPNASGEYLTYTGNNNAINIATGVKDGTGASVSGYVARAQGTYTQGGIFLAMQKFLAADTTITSGQIQGGTGRMPIFVLMSDGDPSCSASSFTNATNNAIDSGWISASNRTTFLTMLTAAYAKNQVSAHYGRPALFYTLGYGLDPSSNHAPNVLDTDNMTSPFAGYASSYEQAATGTTVVAGNLSVRKIAEITSLQYVDSYFSTSRGNLNSAFDKIIQEIVIQSRYYATHINGVDPDFDGYLTFEDKLGEYMEFKALDGIVHGQDYFTGAALAKKINASDLGTIENPTAFGLAFRDSVKQRLSISDNATAFELIGNAYEAGQLAYTSDSQYSNYIGWYQKADGSYAGFYNEGTTTAPAGAVYKNKSYGFYGIVNSDAATESDMMFMSVMLRTEIATGEQTVMWRVPASLMPMITYKVTLNGTDIHTADMESLTVERDTPVRLVYEVGLNHAVVNNYNVAEVMAGDTDSQKHENGNHYVFWTNYFDKSAAEHEDHIAAFSHFVPNVQNERYYYTEDTPIYIKTAAGYAPVTDPNHVFDTANEYYHVRYYFTEGQRTISKEYDAISDISIGAANRMYTDNQWFIKQGTVYRLIYDTAIVPKNENKTNSIMFSHKPFITVESGTPTATVKLGNNGRISLTPETGIRVSKIMEEGIVTDESFAFEVILSSDATASGYPYMLSKADETSGTEGTLSVKSGNKLTFTIKAGETMWITGLPSGTTYTVNEIIEDHVYATKEVSVNGTVLAGNSATGTVTEYEIDDIDFVNGFAEKGTLSVMKTVNHPYGPAYTVPADLSFTALVKLTRGGTPLANYEYEITAGGTKTTKTTNAQGETVITIKDSETVMLGNLPENTVYTVTEQNIPAGFKQTTPAADLTGTITATASVARLVNVYEAAPVSPDMGLVLSKNLSGRAWLPGEAFTFSLVRFTPTDVAGTTIKTVSATAQNQTVNIDLSSESYDAPGRYRYLLTERSVSAENGITYDTVERQFTVNVADVDMDGKLEIASVENVLNTAVTGNSADGYTVVANRFNNAYAPVKGATARLDVEKLMDAAGGTHTLHGFKFGLYDENNTVIESPVTDSSGKAAFTVNYTPDAAGKTFRYKLKEINNGIHGMTYDPTVYDVAVEIIDNYDGTTRAAVSVSLNGAPYTDTVRFTNCYTPEPGKLWFDAVKTLNGRELNEGEFKFNLLDENRTVLQTKSNAADGTVMFDEVPVTEAKDYVFYIVEVDEGKSGIIYSEQEYRIVSTVVQSGSEYVEQATVYYDKGGNSVGGADFVNEYKPASTTYTITATKHLNGRELRDSDNFTFELRDENRVLQAIENNGETIAFAPIEFRETGVYEYWVSERAGNVAGVTYDESEYKVEITVTDDGLGQLHAQAAVITKERAANEIVFNNTYAAAPATDTLEGLKILKNKNLVDGEFEFALISVLSGETVEIAKNDGNGKFVFDLTFETAGTYHYEIKEVNTHHSHISYDNTVYAIGYEVTDDGNGQLKATRILKVGDAQVDEIVFTNVYNPEDAAVTVAVQKLLENKTAEAFGLDGFKFKLTGDNGTEQILETDADGKASVTLKYTLADKDKTYRYTLVEIDTAIEGMVYDKSEVTAEVTITLGDDGTLRAQILQNGEAADAITATFNNVYEGKPQPEHPDIPQTGDTANLLPWFALLFVSGGGIFGTTLYEKKKKEEAE